MERSSTASPVPTGALDWLAELGEAAPGPDACDLFTPLAGDVSRRRYFRVDLQRGSAILAAYPPEMLAVCERFAETDRLLSAAGLRLPKILASSCERGFMLLEDLGSRTLYDLRDQGWEEVSRHLRRAADLIERIQSVPVERVEGLNPPLDGSLLRSELEQTWIALLQPLHAGVGPDGLRTLRDALDAVCRRIGLAPTAVCHRDFMARNLVPLGGDGDGALAVLDHQDLRIGPQAYDLASLLNDSLFAPRTLEAEFLGDHDPDLYRLCVVQRTLKAAGTFARFAASGAAGAPRHLPLIAPCLARAARHLEKLPEGRGLDEEILAAWRSFRPEQASLPNS